MDDKAIRTEFWVSPTYYFNSRANPTDDKTVFAKISDGLDSEDYMFMQGLEECTFPLGSERRIFDRNAERMIFDGHAYCKIRTEAVKLEHGKVKDDVVRGPYGRAVRIDTMPSDSEIPEILKNTLTKEGYAPALPSNTITLMKSNLLKKL